MNILGGIKNGGDFWKVHSQNISLQPVCVICLIYSGLRNWHCFLPLLFIVAWANHEWFFWHQNTTQNHGHISTCYFYESEPLQILNWYKIHFLVLLTTQFYSIPGWLLWGWQCACVLAAHRSGMWTWAERHCVALRWKPMWGHQWASLYPQNPQLTSSLHPIKPKKSV